MELSDKGREFSPRVYTPQVIRRITPVKSYQALVWWFPLVLPHPSLQVRKKNICLLHLDPMSDPGVGYVSLFVLLCWFLVRQIFLSHTSLFPLGVRIDFAPGRILCVFRFHGGKIQGYKAMDPRGQLLATYFFTYCLKFIFFLQKLRWRTWDQQHRTEPCL